MNHLEAPLRVVFSTLFSVFAVDETLRLMLVFESDETLRLMLDILYQEQLQRTPHFFSLILERRGGKQMSHIAML